MVHSIMQEWNLLFCENVSQIKELEHFNFENGTRQYNTHDFEKNLDI